MKILVTGGAGFIGRNLVGKLIREGHDIVIIDNFSTGNKANLEEFLNDINLIEADLKSPEQYAEYLSEIDFVFHLAANADVRDGFLHPQKDIEENIIATSIFMQQLVKNNINNIIFSSTAAALGEPNNFPTPEQTPFPNQTSLYGMSKAACEGILSSYAGKFDLNVGVFRFVSVVGPWYSHGHVFDFYKKLKSDPTRLEILGDGEQRKSYLHIDDIISGLLCVMADILIRDSPSYEVYHIGNTDYCTIKQSASWICEELDVCPNYEFTGGIRGWVGDSPFVFLDTTKLSNLGWVQEHSLESSIKATAQWLRCNEWIFQERT